MFRMWAIQRKKDASERNSVSRSKVIAFEKSIETLRVARKVATGHQPQKVE